jgi:hypothetical protein
LANTYLNGSGEESAGDAGVMVAGALGIRASKD